MIMNLIACDRVQSVSDNEMGCKGHTLTSDWLNWRQMRHSVKSSSNNPGTDGPLVSSRCAVVRLAAYEDEKMQAHQKKQRLSSNERNISAA